MTPVGLSDFGTIGPLSWRGGLSIARRMKPHRAFGLLGAALALTYSLLPHNGVAGWLIYDAIGAACVGAIVVGIRRNRPVPATPWVVCAVGLGLFAGGDAIWSVYGEVLHRVAPVVSLADALYIPAYLALAAGCLGFARSRGGRDPDALLEASIAGFGGAVLVWSLVILPTTSSSIPLVDRVVVSLYPLMDVAILAVLIRLALVPGPRPPVIRLVLASFSLLLFGDVVYAILQQTGSYTPGVLDATWLLAFVALGTAALHPGMSSLSERDSPREAAPMGWGRTLILGSALLIGPAMMLDFELSEANPKGAVDAMFTAIVSILVLWRIVRATRQREYTEETLIHDVLHDPVTGLANRRLLLDRLQQAIARLARGGSGIALLFLDLDRFKDVNDGLGHAAGDRLLAAVGQRLSEATRPGDTVARLGGDEFVVLCDAVLSREDASGTAKRILDVLSRAFDLSEGRAFVTASIGIALATDLGVPAEELIRDADIAMYRAKEGGRNRFEFFDEALGAPTTPRLDAVTVP